MRAIVIARPGGADVLECADVEKPVAQRGEVLVRVHATAVNRADIVQREGRYPAPAGVPANIPGLEYAGQVEAVGDAVTDLKVGDRVFGLVGGGAYAEYLVVHARATSKIPAHLSYEEAAAYPEAFITAYDAMVSQCRLSAGETVLISAAASGVGTAAVQIANAIGARPIGTTRSAVKAKRLKELGLEEVIVSADSNFADDVLKATKGAGVDVALELVGGDYISQNLKCVASRGRIVLVGLVGGVSCQLNLALLLSKRIELRGTSLRARPLEEKIAVAQTFSRSLVPLIEEGKLKGVIDKTFPLEDAAAAHKFLESNESFGKAVLKV
ncbi:MAG: NAD(P)H-quinone oxidoreductase [Cyanobacteria bacterium SZAS LIN-5]|nr:NAD(P)H-quinone oxidoreductase [Cyanobacteria bacterium SZAS LIN-5]